MNNSNRVSNRLINEKSPYLLQHAYNPVDWYPWADEAFDKAKAEDKPIFLSIGYSTCHWCHVMERESFEDNEVAEILNKYFVSIKVDREERPDIDHIYMTVCQAMTGSGGWPLTVIMTPDQKPFFAGTYFPKKGRRGMMGLMGLLDRVRKGWQDDRQTMVDSADSIVESMKPHFAMGEKDAELTKETIDEAYRMLEASFDSNYGGFGHSPKFPTPHSLSFLLRYWKIAGEKRALEMVEKTLEGMYKGGIFDHIGYGFSRYSTDQKWLVPHFEKMLYDNALLAIAYLEAYQVTAQEGYAVIAEKIFTYILRDMTHPEGGFYSAEDADSEGVEGKFYVWTPEEIKSILGEEDGKFFCNFYGITPRGNFEGKSIANRLHDKVAWKIGKDGDTNSDGRHTSVDTTDISAGSATTNLDFADGRIAELRKRVFDQRNERIHPHKDDKVLTAWNGLMIAALSIGARVLEKQDYLDAAKKALDFIFSHLVNEDGRLLARYRDGEAAHLAYLDDYAFLTWALLEMYHTTFESGYLSKALKLNKEMLTLFDDEENGGMFLYAKDGEELIARPKEVHDGALPSGNSVAALNMLRLARLTGDSGLEEKAYSHLNAFAGEVQTNPAAYTHFLMAAVFGLYPTGEIVLAGDSKDTGIQRMISLVHKSFLPQITVLLNDTDLPEEPAEDQPPIRDLAPYVMGQQAVGGKPTAYLCENYACKAPITDFEEFRKALN